MELEHLISNGVIEKHVLGFATPEEEQELQIHLSIFPELAQEIKEVERHIERVALKDAPMPPVNIKTSLMRQIAREKKAPEISAHTRNNNNINYRNITAPENHMTVHIGWKILLISLLSLVALSVLAAIVFYMKTRH